MYKGSDLMTKDDNIVDLAEFKGKVKPITGGNPPTDENWLASLPKGTVFLARPKQVDPRTGKKTLFLTKHWIVNHYNSSTELYFQAGAEQPVSVYTPTMEFSRAMDWMENIAFVEFDEAIQTQEDEEETNG